MNLKLWLRITAIVFLIAFAVGFFGPYFFLFLALAAFVWWLVT